ncbi:MAG: cyclopropane fatty acyl phospholipid synthase [Candidatus Doudnabacteria bacterium]|nr:cyclopropane fatty acyl phospholipid synthase [Candidatus Doudnabacteria bacterium]
MSKQKEIIVNLLGKANVAINGQNPWDIEVHNQEFYSRLFKNPNLMLGESYVDGWWDSRALDQFFFKIMRAGLEHDVRNMSVLLHYIKAQIFNRQKKSRAVDVAQQHYDIGNNLYAPMLGRTMGYTCGYWKNAKNLDEAQDAKFDLVCRKIGLKPGMRVLDLGCGFGGFLKFAAEKYGVSGIGVNISKEQVAFAKESCRGLPVEFQLSDYRSAPKGQFDHIVSIGLAEHVGYKNYRTLLKLASDRLKDGGLFLLHTIGNNISVTATDPWIDKYIFPNGMLPSIKQLGGAMEGLFVMEDWHNFGSDYDKTLMAWYRNFCDNWPTLQKQYGDRFYRLWSYYLLSCAGAFRARHIQLWQLVLSKKGVLGGYQSVR